MKTSLLVLLAAAALPLIACSSVGERPPTQEDSLGAGMLSPVIGQEVPDEAAVQAMLAEYARRFSEGYPIYPGDKLRFVVVGNADLSISAVVPVEGFLNFPHIGKVALVGRTLESVRADLVKRLGDGYLVNPDISVFVEEYAKKSVSVLGAVAQPRDYELPAGRRVTLMQVISMAYGFKPEAEKRMVLIFRTKQIGSAERITIPVDIVALTRTGKGVDPIILPDDVVFIPEREKIYVLGQVYHPANFVIEADYPTTVSQAIAMAGGFTRLAQESGVRINRRQKDGKRVSYVVDVARIINGHPEEDVPLQPGDVIFVPESFF